MNCDEIRARLSADLDGELPPLESRELRRHLDACPACAEGARVLDQTRQAYRSAGRRSIAFPLTATLVLAAILGLSLVALRDRLNRPATTGMAGRLAADVRRHSVPREGEAMACADCGASGAVVCIVDTPCCDGFCSPQEPGIGLP